MRRKLSQAVKKRFEGAMRRKLAEFLPMKDPLLPNGCYLFGKKSASDLTFFILLTISPREDRFTLELAWSRVGQFPIRSPLSRPRDYPDVGIKRDEPRGDGYRFRFASLWEPRVDIWWELAPSRSIDEIEEEMMRIAQGLPVVDRPIEDALSKVDPLVEDATDRLVELALPYFREALESHGIKPSA